MSDECDQDNVTVLYDLVNDIFRDEPADEVVYVLGMLIATAIKKNCVSKDPEVTWQLLREAVAVELVAQV